MYDASTPSSEALLDLYSCAASASPEAFAHRALTRLSEHLGFDGAIWGEGSAKARRVQIESAVVHGRSATLLGDYARLPAVEPVTDRFLNNPFEAQRVVTDAAYRDSGTAAVREMCNTHRIAQLMLKGCSDPVSGRLHWLTLYREERDAPFTPADAQAMALLLPHWIQARNINQLLHSDRDDSPSQAPVPAASRAEPGLSRRQREVLKELALGNSYKQIAKRLGLSDETVKDHVRDIYRKMDVHNKISAISEGRRLGVLA